MGYCCVRGRSRRYVSVTCVIQSSRSLISVQDLRTNSVVLTFLLTSPFPPCYVIHSDSRCPCSNC